MGRGEKVSKIGQTSEKNARAKCATQLNRNEQKTTEKWIIRFLSFHYQNYLIVSQFVHKGLGFLHIPFFSLSISASLYFSVSPQFHRVNLYSGRTQYDSHLFNADFSFKLCSVLFYFKIVILLSFIINSK